MQNPDIPGHDSHQLGRLPSCLPFPNAWNQFSIGCRVHSGRLLRLCFDDWSWQLDHPTSIPRDQRLGRQLDARGGSAWGEVPAGGQETAELTCRVSPAGDSLRYCPPLRV